MGLLRELLASKPVRTPLEFGINENIRLVSLSNEERKRDGEIIRRNNYMTFVKYDAEGNALANSEFSYMNLDNTSEYVWDNLIDQVTQMNKIAQTFNPDAVVDPTDGYDDLKELEKDLKTKAGCAKLLAIMSEQFAAALDGKLGKDSMLLRLKIVTDSKTGKYLQLPKEPHVLEPMVNEPSLNISAYEMKNKNKALEASIITADKKGDAADTVVKKKSALAGL
jgi:hypothetical protein